MGIWNPFTKMYEPRTSEIGTFTLPMLKRCYILHNQHGTKDNGGVIKIPQSKVGVSPEKGPVQKDLKYLPTINFQGDMLVFREVSIYIHIYVYYTFLHLEPGLFQAPCYPTGVCRYLKLCSSLQNWLF